MCQGFRACKIGIEFEVSGTVGKGGAWANCLSTNVPCEADLRATKLGVAKAQTLKFIS